MKCKLVPRVMSIFLVLCCSACTAATSSSTDALAQKRSSATALYERTFGADTPEWGKLPEAFRLWTELADGGDAHAMYYLSSVYFRGISDLVEADSSRALDLLRKAAKADIPEAQFALAWQFESGAYLEADHKQAVRLYEQAANNGSLLAISILVRIYSNGELTQAVDDGKAKFWRDQLNRLRKG